MASPVFLGPPVKAPPVGEKGQPGPQGVPSGQRGPIARPPVKAGVRPPVKPLPQPARKRASAARPIPRKGVPKPGPRSI